MAERKKQISLMYLTLVLALLRGNSPSLNRNDNLISSNFFSDSLDTGGVIIDGYNGFSPFNSHRIELLGKIEEDYDYQLINRKIAPNPYIGRNVRNILENLRNWEPRSISRNEFGQRHLDTFLVNQVVVPNEQPESLDIESAEDQEYQEQNPPINSDLSESNNDNKLKEEESTISDHFNYVDNLMEDEVATNHQPNGDTYGFDNSLWEHLAEDLEDINMNDLKIETAATEAAALLFDEHFLDSPETAVENSFVLDEGDKSEEIDEGVQEDEFETTEQRGIEITEVSELPADSQRSQDAPIDGSASQERESLADAALSDIPSFDLNTNLNLEAMHETEEADEFYAFLRNSGYGDQVSSDSASKGPPPAEIPFDLMDFDMENHEEDIIVAQQAQLNFYRDFNEIAQTEIPSVLDLDENRGEVADCEQSGGVSISGSQHTLLEPMPCSSSQIRQRSNSQALSDLWELDSGLDSLQSPQSSVSSRSDCESPSITAQNSAAAVGVNVSDTTSAENGTREGKNMIQTASMHSSARPNTASSSRVYQQVHGRMPGLLRGGSMDQRWQELASLLSLQQGPHEGSGGPLPPSLTHPFGPHPHHHLHHAPTSLHHHHAMHHPPFSSGGPPTAPYNADSARSVLLQNATLPPPDLNASSPYSMGPPPNLGSAVASSMHLTNSSEPMIDPGSHYKMLEPSHDMIYYPNASNAELNNQTTEGFLSSILNDDDLQLMDMAMNEGMYTMRMMDNGVGAAGVSQVAATAVSHGPQPSLPHAPSNGCAPIGAGAMNTTEDRMEASSDSAVSSMGSERVPPMTDPTVSDNEWVDPESHPHAPQDSSPYSLDYTGSKVRGYDYYGKDRAGSQAPQKKHHMFGKRFAQDQYVIPHPSASVLPYQPGAGLNSTSSLDPLDIKYGCSIDFARHQNGPGLGTSTDAVHNNHTYSLPPTHPDNPLNNIRSQKNTKDKPKKETLSRDEKRARAMNLPISTDDIINLPMDEFNERLSKYDLSEPQLSLIRDIRRRGKNKVAAQNCRKRKLDQILQLADEVQRIRERKQALLREQQELTTRRNSLKERYSLLYRHVFQALRDSDGNPYSLYDYSLQQAADGNIVLVPRNASQPSGSAPTDPMHPSSNSRRDKSKDEFVGKKE